MIKYRIICPLNDNLTTFRVKCTEDDKLYIKKILDRPQFEIYKIIQEKDYDGVPKIKELFYSPENDKYILYEECIQGYTIESMLSKGTCFSKKFVIKMATALCNILKPIHNDKIIKKCTQSEIASRYKNVDKLKFKLSMIKVDDFLFPFKIYLYILIGVIFILPTIIAVFFDLNSMIHMYTDIRRYNLVNPIQESTGYVRSNREQEHICDLIADRNIDGARKILDSHTEKSSTDIVLYSQIYEIEGDYDKAATIILDYLKDNDSGTAVRMYDRLKHLKPHCSSDISEQITPYEN